MGEDPNAARLPLVTEGIRISGRRARLVDVPSGGWVVAFDPGEPVIPPMVAVPSRTLERLVRAREGAASRFDVSGVVLTYARRNYLILTQFRLAPSEAPPGARGQGPDAGAGAEAPIEPGVAPDDAPADADPFVRGLIRDLEQTRREGRAVIGLPSPAVTAPAGNLSAEPVGEGTMLLRRRGRLARLNDGAWLFSPDADEQTVNAYVPMRLVPNSILADIELNAQRLGPEFPLLVTGRVLTFEGTAFLHATSFTVERATQVRPLQ